MPLPWAAIHCGQWHHGRAGRGRGYHQCECDLGLEPDVDHQQCSHGSADGLRQHQRSQRGPPSFTKAGAGALTLSGNNSFTGGINLSAGVLNVNSTNALGTGTLNISGASTIDNTSGAAVTEATSNADHLGG